MSADLPAEPAWDQPQERARTALVVSDDDELAVALRERVPRAYVVVRAVHHAETGAGIRQCRPWPWLVVGSGPTACPSLRLLLRTRPVLCLWLHRLPAGLPGHVRPLTGVGALSAAVEAALGSQVAGLRLAPGAGVELGDGRLLNSPTLQALVSAHPHPFDLPRRAFSSAARQLGREGGGLRIQTAAGVGFRLPPRPPEASDDAG